MKKILIVCDTFAPHNSVSAIRITKIAKYLSTLNYKVTVICANKEKDEFKIDPFLKEDEKIIYEKYFVKQSFMLKKIKRFINIKTNKIKQINIEQNQNNQIEDTRSNNKKVEKIKRYLKSVFRFILNTIDMYEAYSYNKQCKKVINKKIKIEEYDTVITSFSPISAHLTGMSLKKSTNIKWIADFRDPMDNVIITSKLFLKIRRKMQIKFIKSADVVITVSYGLKDHLNCSTNYLYEDKFSVIHNGFDEMDLNLITKKLETSSKIKLVYSGSLYRGMRDIRPIFNELNSMISLNKIKKDNIEFIYMGNDGDEIKKQSGDLVDCITDYGNVDRRKSIEIQNECDIVVVATWNGKNTADKGVIPIKFYEALLLRKPIILLVSGDDGKCELSDMVKACNSGIVYEQMLENSKDIYTLISKIMYIKNNNIRELCFNEKEIRKYSWETLIKLFVEEIEK